MIDFKKRLRSKSIEKKTNPIEIYDGLDRRSEAGPIRPAQEEILSEWWFNRKKEKDLIIKLHTGKGKTLIGLLILQSRLNNNKGPCIYICPNIYLVQQTCQEAEKYGIAYVTTDEDSSLPDDFLNSEKILITHIQKVFNGKSKFGIKGKSQYINTIILDDSHACIDFINESFKIKVDSDHYIYKKLINIFEDDLINQGEGSFLEIQSGKSSTQLPVPYWSWIDKKTEVTKVILECTDDNRVKFTWPLIKNDIENCQCFLNGKGMEISTYLNPINQFRSFVDADHRIFMSATTQNDSFFIKGLGLNIEAINNPLICKNEKWSGEKMILLPALINNFLDRNFIISRYAKPNPKRKAGIVCITPSFEKAKTYSKLDSVVTNSNNIFEKISELKNKNYKKTIVVVNRYDGIDLPDNACRLLIIDSMPYANSLTELYEEECRPNSNLINIRSAQKIEQGLGRSVRSEKDYSVILIIGSDLIKFLRSKQFRPFFSEQTRKQIDIGFELAEFAKEEEQSDSDPQNILATLIKQSLLRDEGWKEFYKQKMDENEIEEDCRSFDNEILEVLELERKAELRLYKKDPEKACEYMQRLIDKYYSDSDIEKGWYLQNLARYKYSISKIESNKIQKSAFNLNMQLLKPKEGISYRKISYINENRIKKIKNWILNFNDYEELSMSLNDILENLSFGQPPEKFEKALKELGDALGFLSQRPDKEIKKGPDNIWCAEGDTYFIFECKSEVDDSRSEIYKSETGQMNNHCAWFDKEYKTNNVTRILVIPTKNLSREGDFTHEVKIMRKGKLRSLRDKVKALFKELKEYQIKDISDSKMQELIAFYKLDVLSLQSEYSENYYQRQ